jgi:hypothetical protein
MGEHHLHRARSWPGIAGPQRGRWIVADVLSRADPSGHESWRVRLVVEASPSNRHRARPLAKSPWSQPRRAWLSCTPMPLTAAGAAAHGRRETSFRRCAPDQSGSARRSAALSGLHADPAVEPLALLRCVPSHLRELPDERPEDGRVASSPDLLRLRPAIDRRGELVIGRLGQRRAVRAASSVAIWTVGSMPFMSTVRNGSGEGPRPKRPCLGPSPGCEGPPTQSIVEAAMSSVGAAK